jgi:hypothetical protein
MLFVFLEDNSMSQKLNRLTISSVFSPATNRKLSMVSSPSLKRKLNDESNVQSPAKMIKNNAQLDKNLNEELVLIYKSKKHAEKMPSLVEQTFLYRRSIIENTTCIFQDLLIQFEYLTHQKNVNTKNLKFNLKNLPYFIF